VVEVCQPGNGVFRRGSPPLIASFPTTRFSNLSNETKCLLIFAALTKGPHKNFREVYMTSRKGDADAVHEVS